MILIIFLKANLQIRHFLMDVVMILFLKIMKKKKILHYFKKIVIALIKKEIITICLIK